MVPILSVLVISLDRFWPILLAFISTAHESGFRITLFSASESNKDYSCSLSPFCAPNNTASHSVSPSNMTYVPSGASGLKVSRIILACMSYGDPKWASWVLREEEASKHIKAAYDAGINTFDTANAYSNGVSELLGRAINLPCDEIVVTTKVFLPVVDNVVKDLYPGPELDAKGYANQSGLSRKHIFDSVQHSLRRLGLDYIDVLQSCTTLIDHTDKMSDQTPLLYIKTLACALTSITRTRTPSNTTRLMSSLGRKRKASEDSSPYPCTGTPSSVSGTTLFWRASTRRNGHNSRQNCWAPPVTSLRGCAAVL
ncbi:NADP-dependent oxidoreductase domain-containing protein [Mycena polygramma]|nr:NADP-dependent oxidoreductase domain-containing protein [Mycena polygramma]